MRFRILFGRWVGWADVATATICAVLWPLVVILAVLMLVALVLFSISTCDENEEDIVPEVDDE